jgi:hypothetical protein
VNHDIHAGRVSGRDGRVVTRARSRPRRPLGPIRLDEGRAAGRSAHRTSQAQPPSGHRARTEPSCARPARRRRALGEGPPPAGDRPEARGRALDLAAGGTTVLCSSPASSRRRGRRAAPG